MIRFLNDYSEGAAPEILTALADLGKRQFAPYGEDEISAQARELIKYEVGSNNCEVHFVSGGTQANLMVIATALRGYEAALATQWGHIATHETGAIEATGHKVVTVPHIEGKLTVNELEKALAFHNSEHLAKIKLLYISQSTEWGTIYSKDELEELRSFADANELYIYVDGARMGSALTAPIADFTLEDIARCADAFTIGGTKNGALLGEAVVFTNPALGQNFRYVIKQRGGLLAKGWLLGVEFKELFRDGLFYSLAQHSNDQAGKIKKVIDAKGIPVAAESFTNQLFPILPLEFIMKLSEDFSFEIIERVGQDRAILRFVTSWATEDMAVAALSLALERFSLR